MEKQITNSIIKAINQRPGCFAFKRLNSGATSTRGFPDITGSVNVQIGKLSTGIRLEIEVKQKGKTPTPLQYAMLRKFRKLNCISFWADSKKDCLAQLDFWESVAIGEVEHPGFGDLEKKNSYKVA